MTTYIKGSGHDWDVFYQADDDPEVQTMSVFGVLKIEDAIEEARFSLDPKGDDPDYVILGAVRTDQVMPRLVRPLSAETKNDAKRAAFEAVQRIRSSDGIVDAAIDAAWPILLAAAKVTP